MTRSKVLARLATFAGAATLAIALFAPAAQAVEEPNSGFNQFRGCPRPEEKEMTFCVRSVVTGGHLQSGKKDVPIKNPITLTGGLTEAFEEFTANSEGGLTKVKQEVPGGVIGITGLNWLVNFLNVEALKLYAVTELAGPPRNFTLQHVTLPIKVHLVNPVLGNNCYIGSEKNQITLNLTTGTTSPPPPNEPITGQEASFKEENEIAYLENGVFVDNAFAVPAASGCTLTLLGFIPVSLDSVVNLQAGLPAAAGTNEAEQDIDIEVALQNSVY
jgi:hypothetical protein